MSDLSDVEIDADLRMEGFDPDDRYPEYGHAALRAAYRLGWEAAASPDPSGDRP